MFVIQNKNLFSTNTKNIQTINNIDTRQRNKSYVPQVGYQKGAYFSGIKILNNLPKEIKNVANNLKSLNVL